MPIPPPLKTTPQDYWCGHCGTRQGPYNTPDQAQDAGNEHGMDHVKQEPGVSFMMIVVDAGRPIQFRVRCKATKHAGQWNPDEAAARAELTRYRQQPAGSKAYLEADAQEETALAA